MIVPALFTKMKDCNLSLSDGWIPKAETVYNYRQGSFHAMLRGGELIPKEGLGFLLGSDCSQVVNVSHRVSTTIILACVLALSLLVGCVGLIRYYYLLRPLRAAGVKYAVVGHNIQVSTAEGIKSLSLLKVLLLILTCRSIVSGCVSPHHLGPLMSIRMSEGESLCFNKGHTTLDSVWISHPLALMYETAEWSANTSFNWGCGGGSCPEVEECEAMDELVEEDHDSHGGHISKTICTSYPRACAFSRGCWQGKIQIGWSGMLNKVYSALPGYLDGKFVSEGVDCNVTLTPMPQVTPPEGSLVVSTQGIFLCDSVSPIDNPRTGMLGSLQIREGITFNWDSIACKEGWFTDHSCVVKELKSISEVCTKLPGFYRGSYFTYESGSLRAAVQDEVLVYAKCNDTVQLRQHHCNSLTISIEGYKESNTGLGVLASARSAIKFDEMIVTLNCTKSLSIKVPCDGVERYYVLSEDVTCYGIKDNSHNPSTTTQVTNIERSKSIVTRVLENDTPIISGIGLISVMLLITCLILIIKS